MLGLSCVSSFAFTITDIKYEGLSRISPLIAEELSGISKGDKFNYDKVGKSILNFYSQGYFEDIWVEEKDGSLVYHFKEKPVISKIEFVGYSDSELEKLTPVVGVKKGIAMTMKKSKSAKKRL